VDHALLDLVSADRWTSDLPGQQVSERGLAGTGRSADDDKDRSSPHPVVYSLWDDGASLPGRPQTLALVTRLLLRAMILTSANPIGFLGGTILPSGPFLALLVLLARRWRASAGRPADPAVEAASRPEYAP
jgi:hypothetical protein